MSIVNNRGEVIGSGVKKCLKQWGTKVEDVLRELFNEYSMSIVKNYSSTYSYHGP